MRTLALFGGVLAFGLAAVDTRAQTTSPNSPTPLSTHAQWINAPHSNEMVWPGPAWYAHMNGHVQLDCVIDNKGKLKPCAVVEDSPKGQGFALAAISFLEPTKMRPPTVDGAPVQDAHVQIMIDFEGSQRSVSFMWSSQ